MTPEHENRSQQPQKDFLNRPLRWLILLLFAGIFVVLIYGGFEAKKTCNNKVADWFPEDFPETQKLEFFKSHFGSNEMVMISWDGLSPDDPIQDELAEEFKKSPGVDEAGNSLPPLIRQTITTREMLGKLNEMNRRRYSRQTPPKPIQEISRDQLNGWLLSRDHSQACILAKASPKGSDDRAALLEKLYNDTMRLTGLTHSQIHIAGGTCDSVAIDEATATSQKRLFPIFGIICSLLLAWCLKNPILSMTVFFIALINQEIGPAAIFFTGSHMDSISLLVSALTFVLSMESGIHLANYYRDSVLEGGTRGAVWRTIQKGGLPCALATITTVLGMGSLAISQVTPICNFGIYTSIALSSGTVFLFCFIAAYWENWPPFEFVCPGLRFKKDPLARQKAERDENLKKLAEKYSSAQNQNPAAPTALVPPPLEAAGCWFRLANFIVRTHWGIILFSIALLAVFSTLVTRIETSITLHGMLKSNNEVIIDYNYLEERFGGLVPIEVVLRIPMNESNRRRTRLEHLELIEIVQKALEKVPGVDGTVSVLNVLPDKPALTDSSVASVSARRIFSRQLSENLHVFQDSQLFCAAAEEEMWCVSIRVPAGADLKYEPLLQTLETTVYKTLLEHGITYSITDAQVTTSPFLMEPQKKAGEKGLGPEALKKAELSQLVPQPSDRPMTRAEKRQLERARAEAEFMQFRDVSVFVSGAIPLVFKAQQQLLKDLIDSFAMAFVLISVTLVLLQRSIIAGLVAMLPNTLPSVLIFGVLALCEIKVDIGSMMTASVALGITVDGTLHFLTWFQRGIALGYARREAVIYAYTHCADAMLQTTFVCSFTFLVFAFSNFMPVARFAWMLCILLSAAVCADLFLTPALLLSPLGRFFVKKEFRSRK